MNSKSFAGALAIIGLVLIVACQPPPTPRPQSTATPIVPSPTAPPAAAVSSVAASPTVTIARAPAAPTAAPTPILVDETDCMGACHLPDPNEMIGAGAKPQPASHVNRTTCLSCHATTTPPLPATHTGRLDPSCSVCHGESAK